jgi:hypothetical protein
MSRPTDLTDDMAEVRDARLVPPAVAGPIITHDPDPDHRARTAATLRAGAEEQAAARAAFRARVVSLAATRRRCPAEAGFCGVP